MFLFIYGENIWFQIQGKQHKKRNVSQTREILVFDELLSISSMKSIISRIKDRVGRSRQDSPWPY